MDINKCKDNKCNIDNDNDNNPVIDLSKFDKNKTWMIFYKNSCNACHEAIKYFRNNGIQYTAHDLDTAEGLALTAGYGVLEKCIKFIPIIIEDDDNYLDV